MTLKVEENYASGVPQTAVAGFAPRGIAWHWTAGGTGRMGAEATLRYFQNTRYTVNASYHILLFREGSTTVAMWIVPVTRASHSINPGNVFRLHATKDTASQTARFDEVRRILGPKAGDPNAGCISVSFCGMPTDLAAAMADPVFVADVRVLEDQLATHPTIIERPNFGHGWIQPLTRYEMDAAGISFIPTLYAEPAAPDAPAEDIDLTKIRYIPRLWRARVRAELREAAMLTAPVVEHIEVRSPVFGLGDTFDQEGTFHLVVAGDPERLYYARRSQLDPITGTLTADPKLYEGIATVVNTRLEGKDVVFGTSTGPSPAELERLTDAAFIRGRDAGIDAYTVGGTKQAKAVQPT